MTNLDKGVPPKVLGGLTRDRAMLVCVGLLGASAVLIAMNHRGFFDGVANEMAGYMGLLLGACGVISLILIWGAGRFRMSIGRFMFVVAFLAVLLQGMLTYRQWMLGGQAKPAAVASPPAQGKH